MLPHAPGVQMADIPEDSVNLEKEVGGWIVILIQGKVELNNIYIVCCQDEELDAADPDKRNNMKLMDQNREADNEFEEGKSVRISSGLRNNISLL